MEITKSKGPERQRGAILLHATPIAALLELGSEEVHIAI